MVARRACGFDYDLFPPVLDTFIKNDCANRIV